MLGIVTCAYICIQVFGCAAERTAVARSNTLHLCAIFQSVRSPPFIPWIHRRRRSLTTPHSQQLLKASNSTLRCHCENVSISDLSEGEQWLDVRTMAVTGGESSLLCSGEVNGRCEAYRPSMMGDRAFEYISKARGASTISRSSSSGAC